MHSSVVLLKKADPHPVALYSGSLSDLRWTFRNSVHSAVVDVVSPGAGGDLHFKTWTDECFDFHGECDLLLVDAPKFQEGLGLQVQLHTKIRYGHSYIETAKIGPDVFETSSWGVDSVNGIR